MRTAAAGNDFDGQKRPRLKDFAMKGSRCSLRDWLHKHLSPNTSMVAIRMRHKRLLTDVKSTTIIRWPWRIAPLL